MAKAKGVGTVLGPIVQVRDLTAGVNLRPSPTNVQPAQARRLLNTTISNVGELAPYPGWLAFASSLGARRLQGARRIYLDTTTFTLAGDNGSVYAPSDAGSWGSAVLSGLNAANVMDFIYDREIVAVLDGANVPKKTENGTVWTQLGISAPTVAPTASAVAGGSLAAGDTYEVSYAYYDASLAQIGNESATVQQAAAGANLTVRVSVTASTDPQVDSIKIYARDVTAGETVRRLQGTYANTTTNRDITANNWDAQDEAPTDHNVAEPMSFGCVWKNRWWGRDATVKNRLRFSQIFQPQSWPTDFYVDIPFIRGEDITGILPLGDTLIVCGYTTFYVIFGQTSLDFEVRPALGAQTGAFGPRALALVENGIVHAGAPGVYLYNGASDELLSYPIEPAWLDAVRNSAASELALLPITYHAIAKEVRIAVPRLYPDNSRGEWILDLNRGRQSETGPAWFSTNRAIGGYLQWDGEESTAGNNGRIFSWDATTAAINEERTGTTANGSNITMRYEGYMLPFGLQVARIIDTYLEYQPADGDLSVDLRVDGRLMGGQTFDLGTGLAVVGTAVIGTSVIAGSDRKTMPITWPLDAEGRSAQFLITYTGQGTPKFYTYGHNAMVEDIPRGI